MPITRTKNKRLLLEMATRGESRPVYNSSLGSLLRGWISSSQKAYDRDFAEQIKQIAPHWLVTTRTQNRERMRQNKKALLEIAKKGEERPVGWRAKHPFGRPLILYTNKRSKLYDPIFDEAIRKLAPEWFTRKKARKTIQ